MPNAKKFARRVKGDIRVHERSLGGAKMSKFVKITYTRSIWKPITPNVLRPPPIPVYRRKELWFGYRMSHVSWRNVDKWAHKEREMTKNKYVKKLNPPKNCGRGYGGYLGGHGSGLDLDPHIHFELSGPSLELIMIFRKLGFGQFGDP